MDKIPFEDGTLVKKGYVTIDGTEHEVEPAEYTGKIPLSAYNLIKMQDNIENSINEEKLVKRLNIEGNSKQDKREGYNKFLNTFVSTTSNGITLTMDKDKMHFEGTSTASTNFRISKKIPSELLGKTATLTVFGLENTTFANAGFKKTSTGANILIVNTVQNSTTVEITQEMIDAADIFDFFITSGKTVNADIYIQLVEGTEEKPYESYGVSPSIDYPSEVKSVGDNISIFDFENTTYINESAKITHIKNPNEIIITNTNTTQTRVYIQNVPVDANKVCSLSMDIINESGITVEIGWIGSGKSIKTNVKNGRISETFTNITTGLFSFYLMSAGTVTFKNLKIEYGQPTPYSPYGQGSIEMSMDNGNSSDGELELGTIEGATGNATDNPARMRSKNFIEVDNTLKYTITSSENSNVKIFIFEYDKNKTYISRTSESWLTMPYQYNPRSNTKYIKIVITYIDNTNIDITKDIELKIYDKFQSNILYTQKPFRAIGDVRDRFAKKDGAWYEEHNIARYIFTGDETWNVWDTGTSGYKRYANTLLFKSLAKPATSAKVKAYISSNYLSCVTAENTYYCEDGISIDAGSNLIIYIDDLKEETTSSALKTKLLELYNAGTPLYVDYVLATPTLIECTPEQVEALNDIYSAYGEGLTNITCTDEVEPVIEIIKETKETVQSNNDKAISALLERVSQLESIVSSMQTTTAEGGA